VTLIRLAINLGFSAGPAIGGLIITTVSYVGLFWVDGITCILATILLIFTLNPKKARILDSEVSESPSSAYKDKPFLIFLIAITLFAIVFIQYFSTMPLFYKDKANLSEFEIGLLLGLNGFLIFLFEMPLIKWLEHSRFRFSILMMFGAAITGLSFVILLVSYWMGIILIGMLLMTLGEMIAFPFSNAYAMKRSKRGKQGQYMALYAVSFSVAHLVGHNLGLQMVNQLGFNTTWLFMGLLAGLSAVLLLMLKKMTD
jgi:predicted MFS family arabinose efflux permease